MTRSPVSAWLALLIGVVCFCAAGAAQAAPSKATCEALKGTGFAAVQDAPTSILSATYVEARADRRAYCAIEGYVGRNNGFVLWLPTDWSGRFIGRGCGGFCGITAGEFACADPIRIGYACVQTDMGHKSGISDGLWAYHNTEAEIDFGYRSTHVTTVAGKAIAAAYYGRAPSWNAFLGCSTGGRQGLVEAERFPEDYNGIVVIAPALNETGVSMQITWSLLANRSNGRNILSPDKLAALHQAVVAACDLNDGVKDGLIGDPALCRFNLASVTCGARASATCLTKDEAAVVEKIWAGPHNRSGFLFTTGGAPVGSEGHWGSGYIGAGDAWGPNVTLLTEFWRYLGFDEDPGPAWTLDRFDFEHDPPRTGAMETIYSGANPDLRRFKALGGKLLLAHGLTDDNVPPGPTEDFHDGVVRYMGGADETQAFLRYFKIPGMNHCTGGEGAFAIDYLKALQAWADTGAPPQVLIGKRPKDGVTAPYLGIGLDLPAKDVTLTRPTYAWPARTLYAGAGDPNDPASWIAKRP